MSTTEHLLVEAIQACQRRIAAAESALAKAQNDGRDLATFVSEFARRSASMVAAKEQRDGKWAAPGVREETVRSLSGLRAAMQPHHANEAGYVSQLSTQQAQLEKAVQTNTDAVAAYNRTLETERAELQRLSQLMENLRATQASL